MLNVNFKTLFQISRFIFPNREKLHHILLLLFFKYCEFENKQPRFNLKVVNEEFIYNVLNNLNIIVCDPNNTVVVNKNVTTRNGFSTLYMKSGKKVIKRKVFVVLSNCLKTEILVSHIFKYNNKITNSDLVKVQIIPNNPIEYAEKVELICLNQVKNLHSTEIDIILKCYFQKPKIIYDNDLIEINISLYGKQIFFKSKNVLKDNIYFKCKNVCLNSNCGTKGALCVVEKSSVVLYGYIQDYLLEKPVNCCSLQNYINNIKSALAPFVLKKNIKMHPIFLINGINGCDKVTLLKNLALEMGMNFYNVHSCNFYATVYTQVEMKIRNIFWAAKQAAPCILAINNFENIGKNHEGQYDERIISFFLQQLEILFQNNAFPVILICSCNEEIVTKELNRIFLKRYDFNFLTDIEKENDLKFLFEYYGIKFISLNNCIKKTRGFFSQDLKTSIYYAFKRHRLGLDKGVENGINEDNILNAIDYMQSNYKKSLDAPKVPRILWSDVGGLSDEKNQVIKIIKSAIKNTNKIFKKSGLLLYGPPGTGKTLIVKAIATEYELCFLSVKGPEIINMYVGQSEKNIRNIFQKGRMMSPCIIFFDELDSIAPNRGDSGGVMDRVVSQLLSEMDGLNEESNIIIIGATNRPDLIDTALLRPGRFDKLIYIGPCTDLNDKMSVLKAQIKRFNIQESTNLVDVINLCPQTVSGADFHGITSNAWLSSARKLIHSKLKDASNITKDDIIVSIEEFNEATKSIQPSISMEDTIYYNNLKQQFSL